MPILGTFASASARAFGLTSLVGALKDLYFSFVNFLLTGETTSTNSILTDESPNKLLITAVGDAKSSRFSPYAGQGYYSVLFNGTTDSLTVAQTFNLPTSTTPFTMEAWVYVVSYAGCAIASTAYAGSGPIPFVLGLGNTTANGTDAGGFPFLNYYDGNSWATGVLSTISVPRHSWSHVAGVFDGTNAKIYVNGQLGGTWAASSWQTTGQANFYLGQRWDSASFVYFDGYITNFRLVTGTAVYTSAFTPPYTPLTAIPNTKLLLANSNRFIDTSSNAYAVTKSGTPKVAINSPLTPDTTTSEYGSVYLDGTGDYLSMPTFTTQWNVGTGDITVEFWVYYTTAPASSYGLVDARAANTASPWAIQVDSTNSPYFYDGTQYSSTELFKLGAWNHFVMCRASARLRLFVNGVQGYSSANTTIWSPSAVLTIGTYATTGAAGFYLPGYMADIRITTGPGLYTANFTPPAAPLSLLSTTQLLTCRYKGGANNYGIIDSSPINLPVTRLGNTTQGSFSPFSQNSWSYYFNGTDSFLNFPAASTTLGTDLFTFECWINVMSLAANRVVIDARQSVSPNAGFQIGVLTTGALSWFEGSATQVILSSASTIAIGTWYHIAAVRAGTGASQCKLYVNGSSVGTGTSSLNYSGFTTLIGRNAAAAQDYMLGYISNLRLVKGSALYTSTFVPSTSPLTLVGPKTLMLTCQSNRFTDVSPYTYAITIAGSPAARPVSPFSGITGSTPITYSNYFDGTGDFLTYASDTRFVIGTSQYNIEFWIYFNAIGLIAEFIQAGNGTTAGWFAIYFNGTAIQITMNGGAGTPTSVAWTPVVERWYHFAGSRDASNNQRIFIDGVQIATAVSTNNYTQGGWTIGKGGTFSGYISNFRLIIGSALYTQNFTVPTQPLTTTSQGANASQVVLLTCQSSTLVDNSVNQFVFAANGDVKPKTHNPLGFNTAPLAKSYTPALHGGSVYFDGTGDYLTLPYNTAQTLLYNFTVELWVYCHTVVGTHYLLSFGLSNAGSLGLSIYCTNASWVVIMGTVTTSTTLTVSESVYPGQWYHLAVARYGSTVTLYVNGIAKTPVGTVSATLTGNASNGLSIGAYYNGSYTVTYTCYVSDVRITQSSSTTNPPLYTGAFIPPNAPLTNISTANYATIALLNFTAGGIIDYKSNVVLEAGNNIQTSNAVSKFGNASIYFGGTNSAMAFNASNQYLYSTANQNLVLGAGDFTIEWWMYPLAYPGVGAQSWLFDFRPTSASTGAYIKIYMNQTSGPTTVYGGATSATLLVAAATPVPLNTWSHVAVVRQGTTVTLYHSGVSMGSTTDATNYTLNGLFIGTQPSVGNSPYYGYMDDIRITVGKARYTAAFALPAQAALQ